YRSRRQGVVRSIDPSHSRAENGRPMTWVSRLADGPLANGQVADRVPDRRQRPAGSWPRSLAPSAGTLRPRAGDVSPLREDLTQHRERTPSRLPVNVSATPLHWRGRRRLAPGPELLEFRLQTADDHVRLVGAVGQDLPDIKEDIPA